MPVPQGIQILIVQLILMTVPATLAGIIDIQIPRCFSVYLLSYLEIPRWLDITGLLNSIWHH